MKSILRPALVLFAALTVICCVVYPYAVTGIGQLAFAHEAEGSLVSRKGQPVGSILIGQAFSSPRYFWGRPSATSPMPNNATSSGGSNLGPTNPALIDAVKSRVDALKAADPGNTAPIPVDLVTSSGSGLDPHISPAAAYFQVKRVAAGRGVDEARVKALVDSRVEGRAFGVLGEPVVNVLLLNLALDKL